jgi:uncharacterized protein (TIGR03435 family)
MMAKDAHPAFEVATIKPSDPNSSSNGFHSTGRHISCDNETLDDMISLAYGVHEREIAGGPAWLKTSRYDVDGISNIDGEPNLQQMEEMYQKLLADRFKLTVHREEKNLPVYAIRMQKGPPSLTKSLGDPNGQSDDTRIHGGAGRTMRYTNTSMGDFALSLAYFLDKPVVDETGLTGRFDFVLSWTSDDTRTSNPNDPPSVFTAIQEQLGLKLESTKASAGVLVVDNVSRPSEN